MHSGWPKKVSKSVFKVLRKKSSLDALDITTINFSVGILFLESLLHDDLKRKLRHCYDFFLGS